MWGFSPSLSDATWSESSYLRIGHNGAQRPNTSAIVRVSYTTMALQSQSNCQATDPQHLSKAFFGEPKYILEIPYLCATPTWDAAQAKHRLMGQESKNYWRAPSHFARPPCDTSTIWWRRTIIVSTTSGFDYPMSQCGQPMSTRKAGLSVCGGKFPSAAKSATSDLCWNSGRINLGSY